MNLEVYFMEILKVENLTKTYGSGENLVHAVDDVSFSVEKGEFVAIVGASGSGKSTLLHLIGGVDRPTSGKIFVDGNDISKMNDDKLAVFRRRQVGIVYQFYNLIPILTVEENITLPCDLDGRGVDRERLEMILDSFGLRARRKHLPNQLSGGQQQRTSIARALINNPSLVLADEPTGNLDSKSSDEVMSMLKMCNQSYGQTVIMITHNLDIAKQADRIITISDGKIVEEV
jgi:ABC-type antimicrobial peptide transport system, ATPase component